MNYPQLIDIYTAILSGATEEDKQSQNLYYLGSDYIDNNPIITLMDDYAVSESDVIDEMIGRIKLKIWYDLVDIIKKNETE